MNIVLTYDPRWQYSTGKQYPIWNSLNTVDYAASVLKNVGCNICLLKADIALECNLQNIKSKLPNTLVFWLNEFMPSEHDGDIFTVEIIEKTGMMYTGPNLKALSIGIDKEATKQVFRYLGLKTPDSCVVFPGDYSPLYQCCNWDGFVIIKPLLQGNSKGINDFSVVRAGNIRAIKNRVKNIHNEFNEPAIVEGFIGGEDVKELTVPIFISFDGRIAELPIIEIELDRIPSPRRDIRYLTHAIKDNVNYLKIPAYLPYEIDKKVRYDVRRIAKTIGCRDISRVDLRVNSSGMHYIEVNVNPSKSKFNSSIAYAVNYLGLDYAQLLAYIPYQALRRYGIEPPRKLERLAEPVMALFYDSHLEQQIHQTEFVNLNL